MQPHLAVNVEECFDEFVREFGGSLVRDLLPKSPEFENADYLFYPHQVIGELKCLQKDLLEAEDYKQKLQQRYDKWVDVGLVRPFFGTCRIQTKDLPPSCQEEVFQLLKKPLEGPIKKANVQIKQTKAHLRMDSAKGLLLLVNDGNYSIEADAMMYFLSRIMKADFTSIDSVAYFTVNVRATMPGVDRDVLLWISADRVGGGISPEFLRNLHDAWSNFLAKVLGQEIPKIQIDDPDVLSQIRTVKKRG